MNQPAASPRADWNWLDRVTAVSEGEASLEAYRDVEAREWYFAHHFPGAPVLPGVFLVEAMAHAAGVLQSLRFRRREREWYCYVLIRIKDARFYRYVRPGDRVCFSARLLSEEADETDAKVVAEVDGAKVARCEITLHRIDPTDLSMSAGSADGPTLFGLLRYLDRVLPPDIKQQYGIAEGEAAR